MPHPVQRSSGEFPAEQLRSRKERSKHSTEQSTEYSTSDELIVINDVIHLDIYEFIQYILDLDEAFSSFHNLYNFTNESINKFWEKYYGVINLSSKRLSSAQLELLGKGLKFCPTPPVFDHGQLIESIKRFFRTMSLYLFFNSENNSDTLNETIDPTQPFSHPELKIPSSFNPPMPSNLEHIYNVVIEQILPITPTHERKRNLSKKQYQIMHDLKDDCDLVIKKADKGSNIVVMNTNDYIKEGERQLNNSTFYQKCKSNHTNKFKNQVDKIINDLYESKEISEKTLNYLKDGGHRTSIFYLLPKIHKNYEGNIPPGRPIVSSTDSPTERISQLLDVILKPLIVTTKSYIEDTPDFISKTIDIILEENDWLVSLDVVSLYTNIPHVDGIKSISRFIHKHRKGVHNPSNKTLLGLLEIVLKCNCFKFNNQHYLQVQGTAMGTRVAPTYANIFMSEFEEKYVYTYSHPPKYWFRFIDDVWTIFRGTKSELEAFILYLNNCSESIKFTESFSKEKTQFLDVYTKRADTRIVTELFVKETDSHSYLRFNSCHPEHNKIGIPYSQMLRICRNCTVWTDFIKHGLCMYLHLLMRDYPSKLVRDSMLRANKLNQLRILSPSKNSTLEKTFYCIVDFNPTNPNVKSIILDAIKLADRSSSTRKLLQCPIVFGYRKPKNISDYIVRADLPSMNKVNSRNQPRCKKFLKCKHCPQIQNKLRKIKSTSTGRCYTIPNKVNCNSKNLIYCIECPICNLQYVGQTKNKLLMRINQHKSDIRLEKDSPVARHFNLHKINPKLYVLQLIANDDLKLRLKFENYWISRLNTLTPKGLNILD